MILSKYLVGLLQIAIILMTSLLAALDDGLTVVEVWQLVSLVVGAVVTVFVPLLEGRWAAGLKVGGAVAGAAVAAIIPLLADAWTASAFIIVVLAVLNALATQLGVSIRVDQARLELADSRVSNRVIEAVDNPAVTAAYTNDGPAL